MKRLPGIDAARGFAVVCMALHHTVDSWVRDGDRNTVLFASLRHIGGVPAPAFMFLAGLSSALVAARERDKGISLAARMTVGIKRGLYVLGLGFAFRIFCFVVGGDRLSDWPILFRVDILNCMGVSLAIAGVVAAFARTRTQSIALMALLTAVFGFLAPFLEPVHVSFPSDLVGNYVTGNSRLVLFPLFPWVAYLSVGYALGEWMAWAIRGASSPIETLARLGRPWLAAGVVLFTVAMLLTVSPFNLYPAHDYWQSSPLWVAARLGVQVTLLGGFCALFRYDTDARRLGWLQLLGRHSLLAYFAHVEIAYGWLTRPFHRSVGIPTALVGVAVLTAWCGALALGAEWLSQRRRRAPASVRAADLPVSDARAA